MSTAARSSLAPLVRRHDRDRYLTVLFAPAERREALLALYAFNYEVARTREVVTEPLLGRIRLQWWRDTIDALYGGLPVRHEIAAPLGEAIHRFALSRARFEQLIDAREADLGEEGPDSLAALETYAEGTSSRLVELALEILGCREESSMAAGRAAGVGYGLTGLLRAIPFHAQANRLYLPRDLCQLVGLDPAELFAMRSPAALSRVVAEIAGAAQRWLAEMTASSSPRSSLPALMPAALARADLARLRRAGYDPFDRRLAVFDRWRSWRLARVALTGHL